VNRSSFLLLAALALLASCQGPAKKPQPKEGYRVVSYDSRSGQWVIVRTGTFDGEFRTKRLTVVCEFFRWGNRESVDGINACDLQVGRLIVPNLDLGAGNARVDVFEMNSETLVVSQGVGENQITQHFTILTHELLQ
jgi:hypothetical protein